VTCIVLFNERKPLRSSKVQNNLIDASVIQARTAQIGRPKLGIVFARAERKVPILWESLARATMKDDPSGAQGHIHSFTGLLRSVGLHEYMRELPG